MSSAGASLEPKKTIISRYLTLWESTSMGNQSGTKGPLVLLYPWWHANPRAVEKYSDLYLEKGFDVLIIYSSSTDFLWPANYKTLAQDTLGYIVENHSSRTLVHGMSIGAYYYTVCLMEMGKNAKYKNIKDNICAQVFDSFPIGGVARLIDGVCTGVTNNVLGTYLIKTILSTYYALTYQYTVRFVDEITLFFKENVPCVPTQLFYSLDDPTCDSDAMKEVINTWESRGMDLVVKCWEKSPHCGHLRSHTEEFLNSYNTFVSKLKL